MKLVLISDTHDLHDKVEVPEGDVLVHAGDLTMNGNISYVQRALDWLNNQPHKHVVFVAGNHDFAFERQSAKDRLDFGRLTYLENNSTEIEGKKFYGSPVQPWFYDWAFNVQRGPAIRKYWDMIPDGVDVLITHGPPMGLLDMTAPQHGSEHVGCEDLIKKVEECKPAVHVFGHIHGGYGEREYKGMKFYNASVVNEAYRVQNKPWEVEL